MKIRHDFVTNSSSSSFIIAKHNKFSNKDAIEAVNNQRDKVKRVLFDNIDYI